jgi:Zn-dependent metalloprotease
MGERSVEKSGSGRSLKRIVRRKGLALSLAGLLLLVVTPSALAQGSAASLAGERASHKGGLAHELGPGVRVWREDDPSGVRFIGTAPGRPIDRPAGLEASASPDRVAGAFLVDHSDAFRVTHPGRDLRRTSTRPASGGRSAVRYQQLYEGVPVIGGQLVVNVDSRGRILSAGGETLPQTSLDVEPRISQANAEQAALAVASRAHEVPSGDLRVSDAKLSVYDSRLLGGPGLGKPTLVWRVEVTAGTLAPIDELVLVDARRGTAVLNFNQVAEAKSRRVCDAKNANWIPCFFPVRREGDPLSGIPDVNRAYKYSGDFYDFFGQRFGRDSVDDFGHPLTSTVRACDRQECPMPNGFWHSGIEQVVFGKGVPFADDFVGHEFTHGFTQFTSNLYYLYQSGAINESISDVFGEFIDLKNNSGTDTLATRWQIFENWGGYGPVRDMQDPTIFGHPDRMTSPRYEPDLNGRDNGGVHANSGVNNKAAYLMTDGGTFNGQTISGLGIGKVARIYYEAGANLLTSASDYADLSNALRQACANLNGTRGITAADCTQVKKATLAVEMDKDPPNSPAPEAKVCPRGGAPVDVFEDDLENTASANWVKVTGSGSNEWHYPQPDFETYATSGTHNLYGFDQERAADYSIAMSHSVRLPAHAFLRFNHAHLFDDDAFGSKNFDGGVVEYKANGGPWTDARTLFADNGYNGAISSGYGNPLEGRRAFVAQSDGYTSSRLNLSALVGKSVRFRFRIGSDSSVADYGWYIDDVRIYKCASSSEPPDSIAPTARKPRQDLPYPHMALADADGPSIPVRIWWPASSDDQSPAGDLLYRLEVREDGGTWFNYTSGWVTKRQIGVYLRPATTFDESFQFRVTAKDEAGNVGKPATARAFRVISYQENASAIKYSSGWGARVAQASAYGGFVKPSSIAGATATLGFSGSNVSVIMPARTELGKAKICLLQGSTEDCGGIRDFSMLTPYPRRIMISWDGLDPTKPYSIQVTNVSGRIELDGIVVLQPLNYPGAFRTAGSLDLKKASVSSPPTRYSHRGIRPDRPNR